MSAHSSTEGAAAGIPLGWTPSDDEVKERLALSPQFCWRGQSWAGVLDARTPGHFLEVDLDLGWAGEVVWEGAPRSPLPRATMKKMRSHIFLRGILQMEVSPS